MLRRPVELAASGQIDIEAATLAVDGHTNTAQVSIRCLREDVGRMIQLLSEVLRRPTFPTEEVTKLQAICVQCGAPASRTQRLIDGLPASFDDPIILVGAAEAYEARCRHCHVIPGRR